MRGISQQTTAHAVSAAPVTDNGQAMAAATESPDASWPARLLTLLIDPPETVVRSGPRPGARLLAALLLLLAVSGGVGLVAIYVRHGRVSVPLAVTTALVLVSYAVGRSRFSFAAAPLAVFAMSIVPYGHVLLTRPSDPLTLLRGLVWLVLPMMLSGLVLSVRLAVVVNLGNVLFVAAVPAFVAISFGDVAMTLGVVASVAGLGLIGCVLRYQNERTMERRLRQLAAAEGAVRAANEGLEVHVRERTRELEQSNRTLSAFVHSVPAAVFVQTPSGRVSTWNPVAERLLGWAEAEVLNAINPLQPDLTSALAANGGGPDGTLVDVELELSDRHGDDKLVSLSTAPIVDGGGAVLGRIGLLVDIGQRRRLEEELRQAQKMEAVGQLAGGIAHDFNNLLTVITGNCELVIDQLGPDSEVREEAKAVLESGRRAAALTRQLLTFSRRQARQPQPVDLNEVIAGVAKMVGRLLSEDVRVVLELDSAIGLIEADPGQIEQVIVNLAVNANDAMPEGGVLTIRTRAEPADRAQLPQSWARPVTRLAALTVTDNGIGMSAAVQERLFEPFFTTKDVGHGTGLGLATVYGIVSQSGGAIDVRSAPGEGSEFRIWFPELEREPAAEPVAVERQLAGGDETILLVEDQDNLRRLMQRQLRRLGYAVHSAANGTAALDLAEELAGRVDLVVTDVVMPQMGGVECVERLRARLGEVRVLFISGHTDRALTRRGVTAPGVQLLQKPFDVSTLAREVRRALERPLPDRLRELEEPGMAS